MSQRLWDAVVVGLAVVFAVYLRYLFRDFVTDDFTSFTSLWYSALREQGFRAAGTDVANYTPPYLYVLYATSVAFRDLAPVVAIKIPSILCDFVCAGLVYLMVRLNSPRGRAPLFAFVCVLLAPTVVLNGSVWGQADSIYTAALLASVYCLMTGRPAGAAAAFGLALSFKLQAMFLAPALFALFLKGRLPLRALVLVPVVCVAMMLPAWLAGRPAAELATVYFGQATAYHSLTRNAPTLYAWLPQRHYGVLVVAGLLLMTGIGCRYAWLVWKSRAQVTPALVLKLCTLSLVMTPFFLPKMHDRFFYPADVLSIAYAFFVPRQYFVPVLVGFASFFVYQAYLFRQPIVPLPLLSLVMFTALAAVAADTLRDLEK